MKKAGQKVAGGVAGVDPENTNKDATRVAVSRPGAGSNDPTAVVKAEDEDGAYEGKETPEEEAAEGREGAEEAEEEEKAKKSLTGSDLDKSLDALEAFAKSGDLPSRKDSLLAKAGQGALSKSEREELFDILGGGAAPTQAKDEPAENIVKSMSENDNLQKALDVSEYLQEQHTELVKSLRRVGDEIQKSDHRRHEFNLILAKAVKDIGEMVKSLSDAVGVMAGQPARAPKALGVTTKPGQVLQKSFAGQPSAGENLTKSQVLDALDGMMEESMTKGMSGATDFGEDISLAVAKYEQTNMISRPMLEAVKGYITRRNAA
jgi:hypothetical protein